MNVRDNEPYRDPDLSHRPRLISWATTPTVEKVLREDACHGKAVASAALRCIDTPLNGGPAAKRLRIDDAPRRTPLVTPEGELGLH
ncbi:hypothetical protein LO763_22620 [Glycomyces sp. A-F 0318]|uniref:hypothetical protein n=1 Tax=Glycomyces amatae TaxID=2881355 RepID=UPI001E38E4BC|nr:hypothetical protein [Glycomyces amatae]MCD0446414.1 hypothetical protein [Glycomyces amatae]